MKQLEFSDFPPSTDKKIQASLSVCRKEGVMAQVMIVITDYYFTPFALFLGATSQQIGLLVALPQLAGSISQLAAVKAVKLYGSRLRFLIFGVGAQAVGLIPLALLAFITLPERMGIFIFLAVIYRLLFTLIGPAWGSLVSDYLPENKRGGYFGTRAQLLGITGIASVISCGLILTFFKHWNLALGFFLLFAAATGFRFASLFYMSKMADLPMKFTPEGHFTLWEFLRRYKESNFVKFVFFVAGITFTTMIAAPYFSVLMLRDYHFSYFNYMLVQLGGMTVGMISFPIWGRHADVVGNAKIIKITSLFIPLIPILWLLNRSLIYIIPVEMMSNFAWGGFNLCVTNFIYDAVSPEKRVRALGYFNLLNGLAIFLGAAIGGFLADRLPPLWGLPLYSLLLISGLARLAVVAGFSNQFKEVRKTARPIRSSELIYSVVGIRPFIGQTRDLGNLSPIRKEWLK